MKFGKNDWIKYDPNSGALSAGGLGLYILILGGLLVLAYIFWNYILLILFVVAVLAGVAMLIWIFMQNKGPEFGASF